MMVKIVAEIKHLSAVPSAGYKWKHWAVGFSIQPNLMVSAEPDGYLDIM